MGWGASKTVETLKMIKPKLEFLSGKNVLCILPNFFSYDTAIVNCLGDAGALVDLLTDRPFRDPFRKALVRKRPHYFYNYVSTLFRHRLQKFGKKEYDFVLVVVGLTVSPSFLNELKLANPKAYFVYYTWDSVSNRSVALKHAQSCDRAFTFDPHDANKYGLEYRPLFFRQDIMNSRSINTNFKYQVSFVASLHSDRYKVFKSILAALPHKTKVFSHIFVPSHLVLLAYRFLLPKVLFAKTSDFKFKSMSRDSLIAVYQESQIILDIEHPDQNGLTIRTLEALGAGKKLITTNSEIMSSDFYDPNNHLVVDREKPNIPMAFIESNYKKPSSRVYENYDLRTWLAQILDKTGS